MGQSRYTEAEIDAYMASAQCQIDKAAAFVSYYAERDAEDRAGCC